MDLVLQRSAAWLAREIQSRRITCEEAIRLYLARIEATHSHINAVVEAWPEQALRHARELDARLQRGEEVGPLGGVPLSIKDSIDLAGTRTTAGTLSRKSAAPAERDAVLVERLRAAGAVPIAKTNLPDLLFSFETDNHLFGRTNNPYDVTRTCGGSSGGEAALLSAGGSALGLGSDAFGSVRLPAAFCGLAAIKPTSGRLPRTGHVPGPSIWLEGLWQIGPMARRVEDLVLGLRLLAYPDGVDLASPPVPLDATPTGLDGLRVAFYTGNGYADCSSEVRAAVVVCATFLAGEGALITETRPDCVTDAFELEMALFGADGELSDLDGHPLQRNFARYMRPFRATAAEFAKRWRQWDAYRAEVARFFTRFDVILCPVYPQAALRHGESMKEANFRGFSYTMAWNLAQAPAATVRCATHEELPINVQVVAKPWADMLTLRVCAAIEQKFGGWQAPRD